MTLLYNVWCDVNGETICVVGRKKKHSQHGLPLFDFVWSKKVGEQDGCVVVDEVQRDSVLFLELIDQLADGYVSFDVQRRPCVPVPLLVLQNQQTKIGSQFYLKKIKLKK